MLSFPTQQFAWDVDHATVNFWGRAEGRAVLCRVTVAALHDHFDLNGVGGPDAQEAFASGRARIEAAAARKWQAGAAEPDGSIFLDSADFS
jgi:hypothetical protein